MSLVVKRHLNENESLCLNENEASCLNANEASCLNENEASRSKKQSTFVQTNSFNVSMLTDFVKRLCKCSVVNHSDKDLTHLVKKIIKTKPADIVDNFIEIYIQLLSELNLNTIVSFESKNMYTFNLTENEDSHSEICTANNEAFIFTDFDKTNHLDTFITNRFKSLINISGQDMYEKYKAFCNIYYPDFKPPSNRMFLKSMKAYTGDSKQKWLKRSSPNEKDKVVRLYSIKPNVYISLMKLASEMLQEDDMKSI